MPIKPHTCVSVECDTCETTLGLGDADEQAHFSNEAEARSWVGAYGWSITDDGRVTCDGDDCRAEVAELAETATS